MKDIAGSRSGSAMRFDGPPGAMKEAASDSIGTPHGSKGEASAMIGGI
jgi:hypothetical protein